MKISKNKKGEGNTFWQHTQIAREKIKEWPEWKKNIRLTEYSGTSEAGHEACGNNQTQKE